MATKLTTVYIEDNEIKLLVSNGKAVEKWASAPLDSGMVNEGQIVQEDAVAERLKSLAAGNGVAGAQVVAAVSGMNSIFRLINVPEVPKNILEDAIQSEATRVIPVPLDQVYLSRQRLETTVPHEMRFFLAAHPKNATDALIRTLHKAGLKSKVLDVAPLALARSSMMARCVVVNTWLSSIDILLMVGRVPEVIRSFPLEAENSPEPERIANIAEEISRTITFYNSSHPEALMGADVPILVSGELARNRDAWPGLGGAEGRPVELLTTAFTAPEGFDPSRFMVNVGMADRNLASDSGSIINLNAIPLEYLPRGVNWFNILAPVVGVLLIGALYYGWTKVDAIKTQTDAIQPQIDAIQLKVTQTQSQLAALRSQVTDANAAIKPVQDKAAAVESTWVTVQNQRQFASAVVRIVWAQKPASIVTLKTVAWDGSTVIITGSATISDINFLSYNVFFYAGALRDTHLFQNVVVTDVVQKLNADTNVYFYDFTLTCA